LSGLLRGLDPEDRDAPDVLQQSLNVRSALEEVAAPVV
jgi:DNA-binding FrmR family transcriptional regulator